MSDIQTGLRGHLTPFHITPVEDQQTAGPSARPLDITPLQNQPALEETEPRLVPKDSPVVAAHPELRNTEDSEVPCGSWYHPHPKHWTLARQTRQPPSRPVTKPLRENEHIRLEELTIRTSADLNRRGLCTLDLRYAKVNPNATSLEFTIDIQSAAFGTRFRQVNLNVRLRNPETRGLIRPDEYDPSTDTTVPSTSLSGITNISFLKGLQTSAGISAKPSLLLGTITSGSQSVKTTDLTKISGSYDPNHGLRWVMVERMDTGLGLPDRHTFKLKTQAPLPLILELNLFCEFLTRQTSQEISIPEANNYQGYLLSVHGA